MPPHSMFASWLHFWKGETRRRGARWTHPQTQVLPGCSESAPLLAAEVRHPRRAVPSSTRVRVWPLGPVLGPDLGSNPGSLLCDLGILRALVSFSVTWLHHRENVGKAPALCKCPVDAAAVSNGGEADRFGVSGPFPSGGLGASSGRVRAKPPLFAPVLPVGRLCLHLPCAGLTTVQSLLHVARSARAR